MENVVTVKSSHRDVGRRPAKNPLSEQISFRLDQATARALDAALDVQLQTTPGLVLSRGDMVRILVTEALNARAKRPKK